MLSLPVRTFSPTPYYREENRGNGEDDDGEEEEEEEGSWEHDFLGSIEGGLRGRERDEEEYKSFVDLGKNPTILENFDPDRYVEFSECLKDTTIGPDDVEAIRSLASSAHISREVGTGPYTGLTQDTSARSVATLVHEQLDVLTSSEVRGAGAEGLEVSVSEFLCS